MAPRCVRDEKGRYAKHHWKVHLVSGRTCKRCGYHDLLYNLLKGRVFPLLSSMIFSDIKVVDIFDRSLK